MLVSKQILEANKSQFSFFFRISFRRKSLSTLPDQPQCDHDREFGFRLLPTSDRGRSTSGSPPSASLPSKDQQQPVSRPLPRLLDRIRRVRDSRRFSFRVDEIRIR